jgi:hypothetical protein
MNQKLKITTGLISLGLLVASIYKLIEIRDGIILFEQLFGTIVISLILVGGLILAWLPTLISKRLSFWTNYFTITAIAFGVFYYHIYSPKLKIVVPENYTGQVTLIKSNVKENILTVDSNGIGYLNEWTFNKLIIKPIVVDEKGRNLSKQCVGFSQWSFFGYEKSTRFENGRVIRSKSFEIVPEDKIGEKQHYKTDLIKFVDKEKIK